MWAVTAWSPREMWLGAMKVYALRHARHITDSRDSKDIHEIQRIKKIKKNISLENKRQTQVDVRQRPGYKAVELKIASGPALLPDSGACPRACIWYIP